jgi:transcriptional regulator with XRE-family HTH domain
MAQTNIDVSRLVAVLDARIEADKLSWRQAAGQIGVSPSLLSRLRNRQRPDLDAYVLIVRWLNMSTEDFLEREGHREEQPELTSEVSALLRARRDLSDGDKMLLENVFKSGLQVVRSTRPEV